MILIIAIISLGIAALVWLYILYISVIKKRNKLLEAFSSVDVYLKKRYDLIPNIVTIAKAYMEHEKTILDEITKLRARALSISDKPENISHKLDVDSKIKDKMKQIIVLSENYPQLKSDQTMKTAMQIYNDVEEHIAAARRFYNSAANELKNAVEIFPSSLFATMLGIKAEEFYRAEEFEKKKVNIKNSF